MNGRRVASTTQERYPWRAVARTILQLIIGLAAAAPLIAAAITGDSAEAAGGALALFITASAAITRLMAVPYVNELLQRVGLGAEPKDAAPQSSGNGITINIPHDAEGAAAHIARQLRNQP